jgi:hypothetical protein
MYYSVYIFFIVLIVLFIEINTNFIIVKNISQTVILKPGTLYISTHNYEHKDIFILFQYFKNFDKTFYMLFADKSWNYLLEQIRPSNIEFIYVKEKTVEKVTSKLLLGENVIMFLYNHINVTGPFYMIKNTNCKLILFKIKKKLTMHNNNEIFLNHTNSSFYDIFKNNFMANFMLSIQKVKYKIKDNTKNIIFMNQLKTLLYN